jgi:excisionase family DNA binding protein
MAATSQPEQQLYTIDEAKEVLRLSRSVLYEQLRSVDDQPPRLRSVTQGRSRRIPLSAIKEYVALLEKEAGDAHDQAA